MAREPTPSRPPQGLRPLLQKTKRALRALTRVLEEVEAAVEEAKVAVEWEADEGVLEGLLLAKGLSVALRETLDSVQELAEEALREPPTARRLLCFLDRQPHGEAELSYAELARHIAAGERATIQRARDLESRGRIEIIRRGPGRGRPNRYRLLEEGPKTQETKSAKPEGGEGEDEDEDGDEEAFRAIGPS